MADEELDERVRRLRRSETEHQRSRAAHDAGVAAAEAREGAAREAMQEEFGFSDLPAAKAELARLQTEMETEVAEIERLLELAGGTQ